jgi:hypothetical protein
MLVAKEKNACNEFPDCEYGPFTRNHYFTGKLLVERDFRDEQRYYIDKHLLHQQRLHGEGVVCGLQVIQHDNPACRDRYVIVEPGLAIDCCGHDILVSHNELVDFTQFDSYKNLVSSLAANPRDLNGHTLQICVCYRECPTEEIPVLYDECGCDDTACAPNRILESYQFNLKIDPPLVSKTHCVPDVSWKGALPVTGTALAASSDAVYILGPNAKTVSKVSAAGVITASLALPNDGKALAISEDGKTLYVAALDAPGTATELWPVDTSTFALPAAPGALAAAAVNAVEIQVPPQAPGKLVSLNADTGEVLLWDVTAAPPSSTGIFTLPANSHSLVAGNQALQAYAIDPSTNTIAVLDLTVKTKSAINLMAQPVILALANAAVPDILLAVDGTLPGGVSAIQATVPKILGTVALSAVPAAAVVSPDRAVAYLVIPESGQARVRPLDLDRLIAGTPEAPGDGPLVQPSSGTPAVSADGLTIYYPETDPATQKSDIGILTVSPHICPDLYAVENCTVCDQSDCLVLATIVNFRPGFLVEDSATPPSDPAADFSSSIARIDNRLGRIVLPSTQKIAEVLDCLVECNKGGIPGPPGQPGQDGLPGADGAPGAPGVGLNADLPKIVDIGWNHNSTISWDQFQSLYGRSEPVVQRVLKDGVDQPVLVIYFNQKMASIDRQTFRVTMSYPQMAKKQTFTGLYNTAKLDLYGDLVDLGPLPTKHTGETSVSSWAFIPRRELFKDALGLIAQAWDAFNQTKDSDDPLDLPSLRIVLSGDFLFAPAFSEDRVLDANNIGGNVGLNIIRGAPFPVPPGNPKNPSGNMVEGGNFESWFFFQRKD